jgi:hypothetical protein
VPKRTLPQWRQLLAESPAGTVLLLQFARDGAPKNARIVLADRIPAQLE